MALVVLVPGVATVSAQEPERGETATTRARPELDPRGARIGGFLLYPRVVLGEEFNDNIFAVDDDLDADFITTITPGVRLRSDWNNHTLNFDGARPSDVVSTTKTKTTNTTALGSMGASTSGATSMHPRSRDIQDCKRNAVLSESDPNPLDPSIKLFPSPRKPGPTHVSSVPSV